MKKIIICYLLLLPFTGFTQTAGSISQTYNTLSGVTGYVNCIIKQPDGKLLIAGALGNAKGTTGNKGIIRLNIDGSIDTSFNTLKGFNGTPYSIALQTDGKILAGGFFTTFNGETQNYIVRLNVDGSKDTTFVTGNTEKKGFNNIVNTIAIQNDNKILIGGNFTEYNNGAIPNYIVRLNSNGTIDNTINLGTGMNGIVHKIKTQPNGKILIGGGFTSFKQTSARNIIRINTDGSIDTSFNTETGLNSFVLEIEQQNDGKILVGGGFTTFNGVAQNYLIRLNVDGSKDNSFNIGTGPNNIVKTIKTQTDGKILVGGSFGYYNSELENYFVCLNNDGSKDTSFQKEIGFNEKVFDINNITENKILVGGIFTTYNNISSPFLVNLNSKTTLNNNEFDKDNGFIIYPNPAKDILNIQTNFFTTIKDIEIFDLYGKLILTTTSTSIPINELPIGFYNLKITTNTSEINKKFIKE